MNTPQEITTFHNHLKQLAELQESASNTEKAARFYRMAGEQAASVFANDDAGFCLDKALSLTPLTAQDERFKITLTRERIFALTGDTDAQSKTLANLESLANNLNDDSSRAIVAARQAAWRESTGDLAGAITVATMATRLAQLAKLPAAEAAARAAWGRALTRQSHYKMAQSQLDRALALSQQVSDRALEADIERYRGILAHERGRFADALEANNTALVHYVALRNAQGQIHIRNNLAIIHQARGRLKDARRHWEEARRLFLELGDAEGSLRTLINLGAASSDVGHYEEAERYLAEAIVQAQQIKLPIGECFARQNMGLVAHYQGKHQLSADENRAAHQIALKMGNQRLQAHALSSLGHALVALEQFAAADEAYWEALAIWESLELPGLAAETMAGIARSASIQDNTLLAYSMVEDILAHAEVQPHFDGAELPVRIHLTCYQILKKLDDARAASVLDRGRKLLAELGAGLDDETTRQTLTNNVPAHQEILAI